MRAPRRPRPWRSSGARVVAGDELRHGALDRGGVDARGRPLLGRRAGAGHLPHGEAHALGLPCLGDNRDTLYYLAGTGTLGSTPNESRVIWGVDHTK